MARLRDRHAEIVSGDLADVSPDEAEGFEEVAIHADGMMDSTWSTEWMQQEQRGKLGQGGEEDAVHEHERWGDFKMRVNTTTYGGGRTEGISEQDKQGDWLSALDEQGPISPLFEDCDGIGSPHGEDLFYECRTQSKASDRVIAWSGPVHNELSSACEIGEKQEVADTNDKKHSESTSESKCNRFNSKSDITSTEEENKDPPLFSALASPRGVRRRIKQFFFQHAPWEMEHVEDFVNIIAEEEMAEEMLFAQLNDMYGEKSEFKEYHSGLSEQEEEEEEEEYKDEFDGFRVEEIVPGFATDDSQDESRVQTRLRGPGSSQGCWPKGKTKNHRLSVSFDEIVIEQGIDTAGTPLGRQTAALKVSQSRPATLTCDSQNSASTSQMSLLNDAILEAQKNISIIGKKKKKKKRRMRRLSDAEKTDLYVWRADLMSEKFQERQRRKQLRQEQRRLQSSLNCELKTSLAANAGTNPKLAASYHFQDGMPRSLPPLRRGQTQLLPKIDLTKPRVDADYFYNSFDADDDQCHDDGAKPYLRHRLEEQSGQPELVVYTV